MTTQLEYAAHRGVSAKTITLWKQRGLICFDAEGGVDLEESDKTIAEHGGRLSALPCVRTVTPVTSAADTDAPAEVDDMPSKFESERVRACYEAKLLQLRFERESAKVAEINDVAATVLAELAAVRTRLATIGSRVAPRVEGIASAEVVKEAIDAEVVAALEELTGG